MTDYIEKGGCFITDLGRTVKTRGEEVLEGRYGVWRKKENRHLLVEVGTDLEVLKRKYSVPDFMVGRIGGS